MRGKAGSPSNNLRVRAVSSGEYHGRRSRPSPACEEGEFPSLPKVAESGGARWGATGWNLFMNARLAFFAACALAAAVSAAGRTQAQTPAGFTSLFNGKDLSGWKIPEGDNGHWKVVDGAIDYDAQSESPSDKNLWSAKDYGNFVLKLDWKIKETPYVNPRVRIVMPDGSHKKDAAGKDIEISVPDSDSGVYLRGQPKAQVNIWCWPVGSGEVYGYRTDRTVSPQVRAGVTPRVNADRNIGEWNSFEITLQGDRLSVVLNGQRVLEKAELPGLPARGPIGLQHHGGKKGGVWTGPPALVQFRNISIREL